MKSKLLKHHNHMKLILNITPLEYEKLQQIYPDKNIQDIEDNLTKHILEKIIWPQIA